MKTVAALLFPMLLFCQHTLAISADELAQYLGISSWSTKVTLPPGSFTAEILEIKDGAVGEQMLAPTADQWRATDDRLQIVLGPSLHGPTVGSYRVTISVGNRGTFGSPTKIPLFGATLSNPLAETIGEGDFIFFGETRKPFVSATDLGSYARGFLLRIRKSPAPAAAASTPPTNFPDALLAAARAGEAATIGRLTLQSFEQRGSLDEIAVKELLDRLADAGETPAFTVLLGEMRKTNLGKNWQPTDEMLAQSVRAGRKELIDAMLASWLDPARLEAASAVDGEEMRAWSTRRVAEVRQERADIDALVVAAGQGDLDTMRRLLDADANINGVTSKESRHTALTMAAAKSQLDAVRLLLERGAAVDQPKHPGWDYTPLCLTKSVAIAELLKAHGANVHAKLFKRNVSILTYIARWGGADMVEWMLKQGLDPKMIGDNRQNLLFDAGDARTAELLLQAGVDPNHVDEFGRTPLAGAQKGVAQKLIEAGAKLPTGDSAIAAMIDSFASPDSVEAVIRAQGRLDPEIAQRGLISAAHTDQNEIAALLLAHGAKANEPGFWGAGKDHPILPLLVCTIHGSPKTVKVLLAHGADPNAGEKPGMLLKNAIQNGHKEVAKLLREGGAKGVSELTFHLAMDDAEKVDQLLKAAPRFVENPDFWGNALPTAARLGQVQVIRVAIAHGVPLALVDGENDFAENAFTAAASEGQHEALVELLAHRKAPHDPNELQQALWTAVWNSHPYDRQRPAEAFERCVKLLLDAHALSAEASVRAGLVQAAVFSRNPGGNPNVLEMLAAAGADPNPFVGAEKPKRLSEVIAAACQQGGCSTPFARTIAAIEKLAQVAIKR